MFAVTLTLYYSIKGKYSNRIHKLSKSSLFINTKSDPKTIGVAFIGADNGIRTRDLVLTKYFRSIFSCCILLYFTATNGFVMRFLQ